MYVTDADPVVKGAATFPAFALWLLVKAKVLVAVIISACAAKLATLKANPTISFFISYSPDECPLLSGFKTFTIPSLDDLARLLSHCSGIGCQVIAQTPFRMARLI
jgi:hypothetical protein